jgi:hypothetical protein
MGGAFQRGSERMFFDDFIEENPVVERVKGMVWDFPWCRPSFRITGAVLYSPITIPACG